MVSRPNNLDGSRKAEEEIAADAVTWLNKYLKEEDKKKQEQEDPRLKLQPAYVALLPFLPIIIELADKIKDWAEDSGVTGATAQFLGYIQNTVEHWENLLNFKNIVFQDIMKDMGGPLIEALVTSSLGIDLSKGTQQNQRALDTLKQIAGFCIFFPYITAGLHTGAKFLFGERVGDSIGETIGKIPEEVGFNWLLGGLLENVVELATGKEIEETINRQVFPNRLDMQTLRALAKQRKIDPSTLDDKLQDLGYPSDLRAIIEDLEENSLPMADIAQAFNNGKMTEEDVREYLKKQGFHHRDIGILLDNYLHHQETSATTLLRSAARAAFRIEHISEAQFRSILSSIPTPSDAIDIEVQAIKLEQGTNKVKLALSTLEKEYKHNIIDSRIVSTELGIQGYKGEDIGYILEEWNYEKNNTGKHIQPAKILAYMGAKIITPGEAYNRLINLGFSTADAQLMVDHPSTKLGKGQLPLKPTTVMAALKDKIITVDQARKKLQGFDINPDEAALQISIAQHNQLPHLPPDWPNRAIPEKDIAALVKHGLMDENEAVTRYEALGYNSADAILLTTDVFYQPPSQPPITQT